ncbi:MAG: c-type cytochrome [Anaerolineales bacterium]|nr:c-type cytochrome [Anaerolineales bacterium]
MAKKRKQTYSKKRKKRPTILGWAWLILVGVVLVLAGATLVMRQQDVRHMTAILAPPEVLAQGEAIFIETCAACHGSEGEGNVGPALNGSMHAWHHIDSQLRLIIRDGIEGTAMVGHKDHLSNEEIDAVISYIKVWWTPEQRQMQLTGNHRMP